MVKVRESHPLNEVDEIDIPKWVASLVKRYSVPESEAPFMEHAANFARDALREEYDPENIWTSDVSCFHTGLEMAEILAEFSLDTMGMQSAILYRSVREGRISLDAVRKEFGNEVARLIDQVLRMAVISTMRNDHEGVVFGHVAGQQSAKIREMLVSLIDDVRVPLIKIAERTCAIRAVKNSPEEKRVRVAREVFDVYAPLAHRLGIGQLKWELEDLAFRYLEPDDYKAIAKLLVEKRFDRQQYIKATVARLRDQLKELNIKGKVYGRAKHIYSIWRKMQRKHVGFSQVYDIRAVRILVPTIEDCYTMLGWLHSQWRNIPNEFDDYIASPKENGYRSLHTAVIGPKGKILEIQIRTFAMHEEAELGVCAHWRYKGSDARSATESYEKKIEWLRQVLEWHEELESHAEGITSKNSVHTERIYVFTPEGHVIDLPLGSTPLDFAYHVHTDIGHRCRGAKVNGRMVPLNTELRTSDQVQIITARHGEPSRDWLSTSMGYLKSSRARAKIQHWFRKQNQDKNLQEGKKLLDRELRQHNVAAVDLNKLAVRFNKQGASGLYIAVGAGDVGVAQVIRAAMAKALEKEKTYKISDAERAAQRFESSDVFIHGVGNLLTQIAQCCSPVPGENIGGYITKGRGVSIHREDCGNFLRLQANEPQRVIRVDWGDKPEDQYLVKVLLYAYDRSGLLFDIARIVDRIGLNVASIKMEEANRKGNSINEVKIYLTLEVSELESLSAVLAQLNQIPNVIEAKRLSSE